MSKKQNALEILLNEYNLTTSRIEGFLSRQDIILQVSIAILGGAIGFTLTTTVSDESLLIIPIIPMFLFSHILYHYNRAIVAQGYREYLQEKLNSLMKEDYLKYSEIARRYLLQTNPFTKLNSITFPLIIVSTIVYSVVRSNYNHFNLIGGSILLILFGAATLVFLKFRRNLNTRVYEFCKNGD